MAVVKANYIKRNSRVKSRAKATIRYIQSRPGKDGEKLTRELFAPDGTLTRDQAFTMIDEARKGTIFYRMVVSPDPKTEDSLRDLDLRDITISTVLRLEERLKTSISFAAAEHNDHAPHRHVHLVALLDRKLTKADINFLRQAATDAVRQQRLIREAAISQSLNQRLSRTQAIAPKTQQSPYSSASQTADLLPSVSSDRGGSPPYIPDHTCPSCSGPSQGLPMQRLNKNLYRCNFCGLVFRQNVTGLQVEQKGGLGLEAPVNL